MSPVLLASPRSGGASGALLSITQPSSSANLPQAACVKRPDALHQRPVVQQVGQLGQGRHDARGGVRVIAKPIRVVAAVGQEVIRDGLFLHQDGQLQGWSVPRCAVVLDRRTDGPTQPRDERALVVEVDPVLGGDPILGPAPVGIPEPIDCRDAGFGYFPRPF